MAAMRRPGSIAAMGRSYKLLQLCSPQVKPRAKPFGQSGIAIDQHLGPCLAAKACGVSGQPLPARCIQARCAQLHAVNAMRQCGRQPRHPRAVVIAGRRRGQVAVRLGQRGHHRPVRRRHRVAGQLGRRYPGQRLAIQPLRDATDVDAAHVQHQPLVRILLRHADQRLAGVGLDGRVPGGPCGVEAS